MSERDAESFDIDDEFLAETHAEESTDYDRFLDKVEKRGRNAPPVKKGKAAWSKLEEVLAEKKLEKALRDIYDDDL